MSARLFIVHGFEGNPHGNWFDWLADQAATAGLTVHQLAMPNPQQPQAAAWQHALDAAIGQADAQTYLVGHSLGCISLLHFLSRQQPARIGGLILAAGFATSLGRLPELDGYIAASAPDFAALNAIDMPVHSVISRDDSHVAPALSQQLAAALNSPVTWIEHGGHLMASDGFTRLPAVWQALQHMLAPPARRV